MCGITGLYSRHGIFELGAALQAANDVVAYRGPDGAGFAFFDPVQYTAIRAGNVLADDQLTGMTVGLGHRRLAILDLSEAGLQPMSSTDGMLWITYNGEIYNYLELRKELQQLGYQFRSLTDTEVILAAYEVWGSSCVSRFNGMWALAIVDLKNHHLFCSRDRFGIKPFYYFHNNHYFAFGSEIKQLLEFPFVPRRMNERAIYEYLAYSAVEYDEETFFQNILKLPHGCNLILDLYDNSLSIGRYYTPTFTVNTRWRAEDAAEQYCHLLIDSVRLHMRSDVEVGSCLSGGLDSSSIVCIIHQLLSESGKAGIQRTFSTYFEDEDANELEYMHEVIRATQVQAAFVCPTGQDLLDDLEKLIWHHDEPFGSTSIFAQWAVFRLIHQQSVKVVLDGQGADEQLAGYLPLSFTYFQELFAKRHLGALAWETFRFARFQNTPWLSLLLKGVKEPLQRLGIRREPVIHTQWLREDLVRRFQDHSHYLANRRSQAFGDSDQLNNLLYQLTFHTNLQALLKYEDRNSMAFSVESRVPYLDYRLVELVFSLPARLKIRDGYTKRVLRDSMIGILPEKIRSRVSKLGFATPERNWQQTLLRPAIEQALEGQILGTFLDREKALLYLQHLGQNHIHDSSPWQWLNLELWMKVYGLG